MLVIDLDQVQLFLFPDKRFNLLGQLGMDQLKRGLERD
uniref:Uncharacterized protein n=1 Tax=Picea glauca TaxID=3330 RepID=A0A101LYH1_PICGL|nr:hypothetical protein ABT39_MTgene5827 [Picea glauca]QHR92309.1 hypothetical protein Q903MT_gene6351 [Picea sitchensis]